MNPIAFVLALALTIGPGISASAGQPSEDSLAAARQLYAAAAYEEALAMLNRLEQATPTLDREIPLTRALCLVGLNREADARVAMASLVEIDPRFEFDPADASPRVRDLLRSVRAERLPRIVQVRYASAKQAFDAEEFDAAATRFADVRQLLDDPLLKDAPGLGDLKTLSSGFADLSAKLRAPAVPAESPPLPPQAPTEPAATPERPSPSGANVSASPPEAAPRPASAGPAPPATTPSTADGVVEPVAVSQQAPEWPAQLGRPSGGTLRATIMVVIDETGKVTSVRTVVPAHPIYDALLQEAARRWRYRPATRNGTPLPYTKLVSVVVGPA